MRPLTSLRIASWNVNRGLDRKLGEQDFIKIIADYDIIFLSECWLSNESDPDFSLLFDEFSFHTFSRTKCKGGGLVLLYRRNLANNIKLCKVVGDSIIWVKIENLLAKDAYVCFCYIPHDNNVFYNHYDIDLFESLLYLILIDIAEFSDHSFVHMPRNSYSGKRLVSTNIICQAL